MFKRGIIRFSLLAAVICVMAAGCNKYAPLPEMSECVFNISVQPQIITKAGFEESAPVLADRCIMELFYDGQSAGIYQTTLTGGQAQFRVTVVAERTYDIAFWADKTGCYQLESLRNVRFCDSGYDVADDSMDAFSTVCRNVIVGQTPSALNVTLTRALSKVRVSGAQGRTIGFTAPSSFDLLEDSLGTPVGFSYANPDFFVFASEEKSYMDINIGGDVCNSVPVQRNHITNIIINN